MKNRKKRFSLLSYSLVRDLIILNKERGTNLIKFQDHSFQKDKIILQNNPVGWGIILYADGTWEYKNREEMMSEL